MVREILIDSLPEEFRDQVLGATPVEPISLRNRARSVLKELVRPFVVEAVRSARGLATD